MMTKKQQYFYFGLLGLKILLGLVFINRLSIDLDEPFSIFHAQKELDHLNRLFLHENNPPLHFWLLHFWIKAFGVEPWAVRSLSLIFSVLTVPVLLRIGIQIKNMQVGLWVVALFVFSNFHHSFGLEARSYALFTFLFSLAVLLMLCSMSQKQWKYSLAFGLILALLFYTHYMALVIIPVLIFVFLISNMRGNFNQNVLHSLIVFVVLLITITPVLGPFLFRLRHVNTTGTWVLKPAWTELYGLVNKFMNGPGFLAVFGLLILYLAFWKKVAFKNIYRQLFNGKIAGIALITACIYIGAFVLSKFAASSVFLDRYLFFVSIGFFALLAWFVEAIKPAIGKWAWIPIAAVVFGFNPMKTHNRASDELVAYASQFRGSYILSPPHYDLTFLYHFHREAFTLKLEGLQLQPFHIYPIYSLDEINFDKIRKPIVLIDAASHFSFGEQKLKDDLMHRYRLTVAKSFPGNYEVLVFE